MTDTLSAILIGSITVYAWLSSRRALETLVGKVSLSTSVAGQILLVWASIVLTAITLNTLGMFSPWAVYACVFCEWLLLSIFSNRWQFGEQESSDELDSHELPSETNQHLLDHPALLRYSLLVLASVGLAQVILFGVMQHPVDWDTLAYHLPIVDHWCQTESLANQRCAFWYVPGNNELIAYWFSAGFSGDFWAQLNNYPIVVLLVATLLALGEEFQIERRWQLLMVVACTANTSVLRQLVSLENDVSVGALFLASILFSVRYLKNSRTGDLALLTVSQGILSGIKYYSLGYYAVVVFGVTCVSWMFKGKREALKVFACQFVGFLLLGCYWYVRNTSLSGSPLYPMGLGILKIESPWDEIRPQVLTSCLMLGSTSEVWRLLSWAWLVQNGPFLAFSTLLVVPLAAARLFACFPLKKQDGSDAVSLGKGVSCFLSLCAISATFIYAITPNVIETGNETLNMLRMQYHSVRFGLPLAFFSAFLTIQAARENACGRKLYTTLLILLFGTFLYFMAPQYGFRNLLLWAEIRVFRHSFLDYPWHAWLLLTIDLLIVLTLLRACKNRLIRTVVFPFLVFVVTTPMLSSLWHEDFDDFYKQLDRTSVYEKLHDQAEGEVVCVCVYRYYPSIGSRREFNVHRPFVFTSLEQFEQHMKKTQPEWLVAFVRDNHWSKAYVPCHKWLNDPSGQGKLYKIVETDSLYVLARRTGEFPK